MGRFIVNGREFKAEVDPQMPLLWVLRDVLDITGPKFGCGIGQCWGCTVLVAGKARPSCTLKVGAAEGKPIITIEGIPWDHPVKQAWVEMQVPQCGYCQPGQILQAVALLSGNPDPGDADIAAAMRKNLCRCGTYARIKAAVKRAANLMKSGRPVGMRLKGAPGEASTGAPDQDCAINPFVRISPDGRVTVIAKHLESGQGIYTGLATLVAEELDVDWGRVRVESAPADERVYNNLFFGALQGTGGSTGIANSYDQYRQAGAMAKTRLIAAAAADWGVRAEDISVKNGILKHARSGRQADIGTFARQAAAMTAPDSAPLKAPADFARIGRQNMRLDIEAKVHGSARYALDERLPGMLTAMVARPPRFGGKIKSVDAKQARAVPGVVDIVEIPEGVAVVAENTWSARRGRDALKIQWDDGEAEMRGTAELLQTYAHLLEKPGLRAQKKGDVEKAFAAAARTLEATFTFPYLAHAPLEPLNCIVRLSANGCDIWAGDQFQTVDQANAATAAGMDIRQVNIHTLLAGGSFGRRANPGSDYIVEAVYVAKALGGRAPIHLIWTREDDIRGGRYRPMFMHHVRAGIDAAGAPLAWHHRLVGQSILSHTPFEDAVSEDGIDVVSVEGAADMPYAIPHLSVELHSPRVGVPVLWWRSVGHSHTAFAVEVFLDELAAAGGRDPVELRRTLLAGQPRHLGVLNLAAQKAGWASPPASGRGRGIALHKSFDSYVAQVAEVSIDGDGGYQVEKVVCAVDCGTAVNPEIIRAQMEGGIAFGLSAALGEAVTLDAGRVRQSNFDSYRPLRCHQMPDVEVHIVPSQERPTGVGEPGVPPIAPAVANALFAVTGRRFRRLPLLETGNSVWPPP